MPLHRMYSPGIVGAGAASAPEAPYVANPVSFDGTSDRLTRGAGLTGQADSTSCTVSLWLRRHNADNVSDQRVLYATRSGLNACIVSDLFTDDILYWFFRQDGSNTTAKQWTSANTINDTDWHHIVFSFDGTHIEQYIDDASDISIITNSNVNVDFGAMIEVAFGDGLGGDAGDFLDADVADVQVWFGTRVDLSQEANRRLFISADGIPVDPAVAAASLGDQIILFSGPTDTWHTNDGTGGGFTETGALTDGAVPLPASDEGSPAGSPPSAAVALGNTATHPQETTSTSWSGTNVTVASDDNMAVALLSVDNGDSTNITISLGGQAMTPVPNATAVFSHNWANAYYLLAADLPADGPQAITGSFQFARAGTVTVVMLKNAAQEAPSAAVADSGGINVESMGPTSVTVEPGGAAFQNLRVQEGTATTGFAFFGSQQSLYNTRLAGPAVRYARSYLLNQSGSVGMGASWSGARLAVHSIIGIDPE